MDPKKRSLYMGVHLIFRFSLLLKVIKHCMYTKVSQTEPYLHLCNSVEWWNLPIKFKI